MDVKTAEMDYNASGSGMVELLGLDPLDQTTLTSTLLDNFSYNVSTGSEGLEVLEPEVHTTFSPVSVLLNNLSSLVLDTSTTPALWESSSAESESARHYNTSLFRPECSSELIPTIDEYFTAFNMWGVMLFTGGLLAVCIVLVATCDTLKHVLRFSPPLVKTHSAFILTVYPVVALATYCATIVPRAQLLAEAITQGMFMAAMYQLFCLMVGYCGGEAELIRRVKPMSLSPRVGPCCCWPCCCCLPLLHIDKDRVRWLRVLVLQLPVVQGLVYLVLLVMWAEEQSLYQINYMYLQPLVVMSILCGVWGIIMTMKMLTETLQGYHIQGKFIVLQLVLILAKLQGVWARLFVWFGWLPCKPPITPTVYANLAYNSLILWEMVLLSLCARQLYKRSLPESQTNKHSHIPQQIHTITDKLPASLNNNTTSVRF